MKKKRNTYCCLVLTGILFLVGFFCITPCDAQEAKIDEKAAIDNVKTLLSASKIIGADASAKNWVEIDQRTVALKTLERNLSIMRSKLGKKTAEYAIEEARALFDPLLKFSIAYSGAYTYDRTEQDQKWKKSSTFIGGEHRITYTEPSPVEYLRLDQERPEGYYPAKIKASEESLTGADTSLTYSMSLFQHIPWGSDLSLGLTTIDKESYWINDDQSHGSYERPWKSTFSETLTIPLPWCKDFGRFSSNDVRLEISRLEDEQVFWNVKSVINNTLLQVDLAYWTLVADVMNLNAVNGHLKKIDLLLKNTQSLYDERMATEYDLSQVKLEQAIVREQQQVALNRVIQASNVLIRLMDADKDTIFLPVGYRILLESKSDDVITERYSEEIRDNPELKKQAFRIKIAEIELNQRHVQKRPDVNLTQRLTFTQSNSTYGLESMWDSVSEVFASPDMIRQNYSISYRYPLFNRSVKSNYDIAALNMEIEKTLEENLTNRINREINNAKAALAAAQARLRITENNLKLTQLAYDKAVDLQKSREAAEYEIVYKSSDLLDAELAYIKARIEQKMAEASLLAALGRLPETYAQKTAKNELDRYRIDLLERNNMLHYFKEKTL